ncbi:MAG: hypothetical protein FWB96_10330 [Defluviitaleaceae bacterium]|nr:hypothetical protein [Defluviitaleaceae bacterium]MCL2263287.1 hypothetical protein [Defluviitaleaceae bacterium]
MTVGNSQSKVVDNIMESGENINENSERQESQPVTVNDFVMWSLFTSINLPILSAVVGLQHAIERQGHFVIELSYPSGCCVKRWRVLS